MCDYSLYAIPNRLAEDGELVVLHKFGTGTIGFASVLDLPPKEIDTAGGWKAFCAGMKALLLPRSRPCVMAVCMPPGTRLTVGEVPKEVQREHSLRFGDVVAVTEITSQSYSYLDALVLPNGKCVLLQELPEGMLAFVLSTALEPVESDAPAELVEVYVR